MVAVTDTVADVTGAVRAGGHTAAATNMMILTTCEYWAMIIPGDVACKKCG